MVYEIEKGDELTKFRAVAHLDNIHGKKARAILAKVPKLSPYEEGFWRSFWEISTERPQGMAPGAIPRSAIKSYAADEGLGRSDAMIFMRVIRNMDNAYLNALDAKRKADQRGK